MSLDSLISSLTEAIKAVMAFIKDIVAKFRGLKEHATDAPAVEDPEVSTGA